MSDCRLKSIIGCLLGTAVGDAIGLPYEGLSRRRAARIYGSLERHRFLFGRGMVSDDTEHTCIVAQALIASAGDVDLFRRYFARQLRLWLLGLPAGIGVATLKSCLRLCVGFSPSRSGVFSAGNGPAMRAAILGAAIDDPRLLRELVQASTRITHTDPKAEYGAWAVASAARMACRDKEDISPEVFIREFRSSLQGEGSELTMLLDDACASVQRGDATVVFADSLGCTQGVSGYVYHSVPVAIHAWLSNPEDYRSAVMSVVECGGDTDSTAAIVGGIVGARVGKRGIPSHWLQGLFEWPRTIGWLEQLGRQLDSVLKSQAAGPPIRLPVWGLLPRNVFFVAVVLYHGFRRLLPPY